MDVIVPDVDLVVSRDTKVKAVVGAFPSTRPNGNELQDKFEFLGELGCGAFGSVFRARNRETNQIVAIKRFHDYNTWEKTGVPTSVLRECSCQKNMKHRNVVELLDVFVVSAEYNLIFEYVESDLHQLLAVYKNDGEKFPMARVKVLSRDLFTGLRFCHLQRVLHRDLKPQNLLVTDGGVLKIGDFGLAREDRRLQQAPKTKEVVTLWYRAPELLMGAPDYSYPIDIWSSGCIVAEMCTGNPIFPGDSEIDTIYRIFRLLGTPSLSSFEELVKYEHYKAEFPQWPSTGLSPLLNQRPDLGAKGIDLLHKLLAVDPKHRPRMRKVKAHEFLAEC